MLKWTQEAGGKKTVSLWAGNKPGLYELRAERGLFWEIGEEGMDAINHMRQVADDAVEVAETLRAIADEHEEEARERDRLGREDEIKDVIAASRM